MSDRTAPWPRSPRSGAPSARITTCLGPNGKVRRFATLTPGAHTGYAEAVAAVVTAVERRLGPEVVADRTRPSAVSAVRLAPWGPARRRWRAAATHRLEGPIRALVVADVRDCFASVTPEAVRRSLRTAGAPAQAVDRVVACLMAFADDGVVGLPVGPAASAVLANVTMSALDDALRARGVPHLRWVDDVAVFVPSLEGARQALEALRRSGARIGLDLQEAKTRIVDDPAEARSVFGGPNSRGAAAGMA